MGCIVHGVAKSCTKLSAFTFTVVSLFLGISSGDGFCFFFFAFSVTIDIGEEKAMAPHSSTLAWKIPWTEEPGGLQSMGSLGVRHD